MLRLALKGVLQLCSLLWLLLACVPSPDILLLQVCHLRQHSFLAADTYSCKMG